MKSLTKILKNSGPRTEPCGTPDTISCHSLNVEPTFTRCFLCERSPKVLQNLPEELRVPLMRELEGTWNLDLLLKEFKNELEIREKCQFAMSDSERKVDENSRSSYTTAARSTPRQSQTTAATLLSNTDRRNSNQSRFTPHCAFCEGEHPSQKCTVVTDHKTRREIVKRKGRC